MNCWENNDVIKPSPQAISVCMRFWFYLPDNKLGENQSNVFIDNIRLINSIEVVEKLYLIHTKRIFVILQLHSKEVGFVVCPCP
jgi:hypothetical protein